MDTPGAGQMIELRCNGCNRLIRNAAWLSDQWVPLWRAPGGTPRQEPRLLGGPLPDGQQLVFDGRLPMAAGACRPAGPGDDPFAAQNGPTVATRYEFTCAHRGRSTRKIPITRDRLQELCWAAYRSPTRVVLL